MPVLFMDLEGHLPKYKGKYNVWVIAISRSEAEPEGKLQKSTLITTANRQQCDVRLISRRWIILYFIYEHFSGRMQSCENSTAFILYNQSRCISACGGRRCVASRIFRTGQNSWYLITDILVLTWCMLLCFHSI